MHLYLVRYQRERPAFTPSCLRLPRSEVSDVRPRPLLRQASVLHAAENAAGCHGSSAGNGEGGARLQLRLPPDEHQHPGGELRPHRARLHHHVCRTVLPCGNGPSALSSHVLQTGRRPFTLFRLCFSVLMTGSCLHRLCWLGGADGLYWGLDLWGETHRGVSSGSQLPRGYQLQVRRV